MVDWGQFQCWACSDGCQKDYTFKGSVMIEWWLLICRCSVHYTPRWSDSTVCRMQGLYASMFVLLYSTLRTFVSMVAYFYVFVNYSLMNLSSHWWVMAQLPTNTSLGKVAVERVADDSSFYMHEVQPTSREQHVLIQLNFACCVTSGRFLWQSGLWWEAWHVASKPGILSPSSTYYMHWLVAAACSLYLPFLNEHFYDCALPSDTNRTPHLWLLAEKLAWSDMGGSNICFLENYITPTPWAAGVTGYGASKL